MSYQKSSRNKVKDDGGANRLSAALDKKLFSYAMVASLGLAALPAAAEGVYRQTNKPVVLNAPEVELDLNWDGVVDFTFDNWSFSSWYWSSGMIVRAAQPGNGVGAVDWHAKTGRCDVALALPPGVIVNQRREFLAPAYMWFAAGTYSGAERCGLWTAPQDAFLGVKFLINGEPHYGWVRMNTFGTPTITGYAYETVANAPIATRFPPTKQQADGVQPESAPGSLGALARGTAGMKGK